MTRGARKRPPLRRYGAVILAACALALGGCSSEYKRYRGEFSGLFDTATVIIGYAKSESAFNRQAEAFYERMKELNALYDIYGEYDGINNIYTINENAGTAPVKVDAAIIGLLKFSVEGYYKTDGMVNVAMGAVLKIWHEYRENGRSDPSGAELPPMDALRAAAGICDIRDLIIDEENSTVFLRRAGMSIDVGAVAKSYAAGLAIEDAKAAGMESALFSVGGDVIALNKPLDGRETWGVGVQDPELDLDGDQNILDTLFFNDNTVSCSGGYVRFYTVGGKVYNHIISPETLMPPDLYKNVSVLHPDPAIGDLLSTALFILPVEDGKKLLYNEGAEALWVYSDGTWDYTDGYASVSKTIGGNGK